MPQCRARKLPRVRRGFVALALLLGACQPAETPVRLAFEVRSGHAVDPALRFYVSELKLHPVHGPAVPVRLDESRWQGGGTSLVALGGASENPGVAGRAAHDGPFEAVEFLLGIPFQGNHGNPLRAAPPLDVPSMFWSWQSGYKFLRLDLGSQWSFHLGSTGCVSASAVRPPTEPCLRPNIARIRLAGRAPTTGTVVVDLDALLAHVDTAAEDNCVGTYADRAACRGLLTALGMDPAAGRCIDGCRGQAIFRFALPHPSADGSGPP